jgi:hypothetical protein
MMVEKKETKKNAPECQGTPIPPLRGNECA